MSFLFSAVCRIWVAMLCLTACLPICLSVFPSAHLSVCQAVFGLERAVDLTLARAVPSVAYATTIGIRFVNNVIGGEQFIDLARWAGVQ